MVKKLFIHQPHCLMVNGFTFLVLSATWKSKDRRWSLQANAFVSKSVWIWATHLDKGFQVLLTSFGDLKHEEEIKKHKTRTW